MATAMVQTLVKKQSTRMQWTRQEVLAVLTAARTSRKRPDFRGQDFSWLNPETNTFHRLRLDNIDARGAIFDGANLHHVSLIGASLQDATFIDATAQETDFTSASLDRADMTNSTLLYATLAHAHLSCVTMKNVYAFGADLSNIHGLSPINQAQLRGNQCPKDMYPQVQQELAHLLSTYTASDTILLTALKSGCLDGSIVRSRDNTASDIFGWIEYILYRYTSIPERDQLPALRRYGLNIGRGDTPDNNSLALQLAQWIMSWQQRTFYQYP